MWPSHRQEKKATVNDYVERFTRLLPLLIGPDSVIVLQNRRGQVVGIEVKASTTTHDYDFRGLRYLQNRLGDDFMAGFVLHLGPQTLPFGDRLRAVPVSALWSAEAELRHQGTQ